MIPAFDSSPARREDPVDTANLLPLQGGRLSLGKPLAQSNNHAAHRAETLVTWGRNDYRSSSSSTIPLLFRAAGQKIW